MNKKFIISSNNADNILVIEVENSVVKVIVDYCTTYTLKEISNKYGHAEMMNIDPLPYNLKISDYTFVININGSNDKNTINVVNIFNPKLLDKDKNKVENLETAFA